jgi:hypothetical protein
MSRRTGFGHGRYSGRLFEVVAETNRIGVCRIKYSRVVAAEAAVAVLIGKSKAETKQFCQSRGWRLLPIRLVDQPAGVLRDLIEISAAVANVPGDKTQLDDPASLYGAMRRLHRLQAKNANLRASPMRALKKPL